MIDLSPLLLSFKLAGLTTLILLFACTPLAWWLARSRSILKPFLEAVFSLPLVLPPTVLGFYLLILLNKGGIVGKFWLDLTGEAVVFNFTGLLVGSAVFSLPFVLRPLQNAFESVSDDVLEAAATLKATPLDRFISIVFPMARAGYLSAGVLGFAHTLGEFGVVLMLGGNIPGSTRTVSIAIYDYVEQLSYREAHTLSAILMGISFVLLVILFSINRRITAGKGAYDRGIASL